MKALYTEILGAMRTEILCGIGQLLMAATLLMNSADTEGYAAIGNASSIYAGMFLAGAGLSWYALNLRSEWRPVLASLASFPFLTYPFIAIYASVAKHGIDYPLSVPILSAGVFVLLQRQLFLELKQPPKESGLWKQN